MPRLILFAACEKVIVDSQSHTVSLTSLLQDINVGLVPGAPTLPSNAIAPMNWATVTMFRATPEDSGKTYEQRTIVEANERTLIQTNVAEFQMKTETHNIISQISGIPVGDAGPKSIKCMLREKGQPEWKEIASYPISVKWHTRQ